MRPWFSRALTVGFSAPDRKTDDDDDDHNTHNKRVLIFGFAISSSKQQAPPPHHHRSCSGWTYYYPKINKKQPTHWQCKFHRCESASRGAPRTGSTRCSKRATNTTTLFSYVCPTEGNSNGRLGVWILLTRRLIHKISRVRGITVTVKYSWNSSSSRQSTNGTLLKKKIACCASSVCVLVLLHQSKYFNHVRYINPTAPSA